MKPIVLLGEAQGENEAKINSSFVGASGIELLRMLNDSAIIELTSADYDYLNKFYNTGDPTFVEMVWLLHPEVHRANVFNRHPPGNDIGFFCGPKTEGIPGYGPLVKPGGHVRDEFRDEIERLANDILEIDPHLIMAMGNTPLWALTNRTGISKLRGTTCYSTYCVSGYKLLPCYHPTAVLRQWENRPVTIADFMKAKREAEYPDIRRPECTIYIPETVEDLEQIYEQQIRGCRTLSVDIETSGNQITCIGFSPTANVAVVVPFYDTRRKDRCYWRTREDESQAWKRVRFILECVELSKCFQNGLYDIAFLWRSVGIRVYGATEDTMLLHHALQPESLKGLGFLGSVYSSFGSWKLERRSTTIKRDD